MKQMNKIMLNIYKLYYKLKLKYFCKLHISHKEIDELFDAAKSIKECKSVNFIVLNLAK